MILQDCKFRLYYNHQ